MKLFSQLIVNGMVNGMLYAMLAIGFGLVFRSIRVFHIAYGSLFVLSSYLFYTFSVIGSLGWLSALVLTIICASAIGLGVEKFLYLPFYNRNASPGVVLIASLGFFMVVEHSVAMIFGSELKSISGAISEPWISDFITLTKLQGIQFATGLFVVSICGLLISRSWIFKTMWAIGDEPNLILVLGIPLLRLRSLALVCSTILVAIPASLICLDVGTDPFSGMHYLLIAAVAVLVGGINSYNGWICGALALALIQSLVVWQFSAQWMDLVTFALLVLVLMLRPEGLMEKRKRVEEVS